MNEIHLFHARIFLIAIDVLDDADEAENDMGGEAKIWASLDSLISESCSFSCTAGSALFTSHLLDRTALSRS